MKCRNITTGVTLFFIIHVHVSWQTWCLSNCAKTHNPQTIHVNFRQKIPDAVLPPASRLWVGEVRKDGWARPNLDSQDGDMNDINMSQWVGDRREKTSYLPNQDVAGGILNEDVSFQSIIKGKVSSRRAGAADPRVLKQKPGQHDSVTSWKRFAAICWKYFANDYFTIFKLAPSILSTV